MGLGGMKYAWQRQTKDLAHTKGDQYSSLVIDNRGIGDSDKPRFRYSTSEMAKDVVEVLDHIGWTRKRELQVIGISMGGMIAQELVCPANFRSFSCSHDAMLSYPFACVFVFGYGCIRSTNIHPQLYCMGLKRSPNLYNSCNFGALVFCFRPAPLHPRDLPLYASCSPP